MARIEGVSRPPLMARLAALFMPIAMKKLTGRDPQRNDGLQPLMLWAYKPKLMMAMGKYNAAVRRAGEVEERIRNLVELKGAQMIGCEFCVDLGSQICRHSGFSDAELLALPNYRSSNLFDEREKAALDFTVAVMRTPVQMTDEVFERAQQHFSNPQLVEITALLTLVNLDRFNAAFGIGSAGYSEGRVCVVPDRPSATLGARTLTGPT
jgi:4-carboxymuconolactone decarboxylase